MLHGKADSEGTFTPKSPQSPKQPIYYVLSPTHDSNSNYEDNKSSPPQTSPLFSSPMDSPTHPSRHSHSSSSSRVSGFGKLGRRWSRKRGWSNECSVIKEEEEFENVYFDHQRCKFVIGVVGLVMLFALSCLILWGASRPYRPHVSVKSLKVYTFYYGIGADFSGVPTKMLSMNCSVKMSINNPATFFGIHVHSTVFELFFSRIAVATGQLSKEYLPRKSEKIVDVNIKGQRVPLYGAGANLPISNNNYTVPLKLDIKIISGGSVVGKLVQKKHLQHISCSTVVLDSRNSEVIKFDKNSCS